ncbi:MAG TPA: hypothetical protein VGR26_17985 [Acidimicrobiales bacterium]|nr:hypothetical protein [Acidimicrobiales bacterium]
MGRRTLRPDIHLTEGDNGAMDETELVPKEACVIVAAADDEAVATGGRPRGGD